MTTEEKIEYWTKISDDDFIVAETMLKNHHRLYTGFMCHQVIEKREDIIEKVKDYQTLVKQNDFPMPIVFGSYAKGTANKDSDIDVALVVNHFYGDFFDVIPPIWLLGENIDFRIEPHVIACDTDYAGFLDEIQRTGTRVA